MGYQFFLPMVLRWRASRAEAPLKRQEIDQKSDTNILPKRRSENWVKSYRKKLEKVLPHIIYYDRNAFVKLVISADDMKSFVRGTRSHLTLFNTINLFSTFSGLCINYDKTEILSLLGNIEIKASEIG